MKPLAKWPQIGWLPPGLHPAARSWSVVSDHVGAGTRRIGRHINWMHYSVVRHIVVLTLDNRWRRSPVELIGSSASCTDSSSFESSCAGRTQNSATARGVLAPRWSTGRGDALQTIRIGPSGDCRHRPDQINRSLPRPRPTTPAPRTWPARRGCSAARGASRPRAGARSRLRAG